MLKRQHAARLAIVGRGPDLHLVVRADQFGDDAQTLALGANGAFDQISGIQFATDLGQRLRGSFVNHYRRTADDFQMLRIDLSERGDDLLGKTVADIFALAVAAEIFERQHGQRHLRGRFGRLVAYHRHAGNEAVAVSGNGGDVAILAAIFRQRLAQCRNFLVEIVFFHHGAGPDRPHQLAFFDHSLPMAYQVKQRVEGLWRERYSLCIAHQQTLAGVDAELAELESNRLCRGAGPEFEIFRKIHKDSAVAKDGRAGHRRVYARSTPARKSPWRRTDHET